MSRYIDADTFKAIINEHCKTQSDKEQAYWFGVLIDMQPTADVVEVVRCKDCKHYKAFDRITYGKNTAKACCRGAKRKVNENDYCSYGERREENEG